MRASDVSISAKKDKIVIKIQEDADEEKIIGILEKKLPQLKKLYKEEKTPIEVIGKTLKNSEMDEIQKIIKSKIDVQIEFETPKTLGLHSIKRTFSKNIENSETKFHKGSLRSGQKIEYEGSIAILGDVNAGAEVIAGENIIILGNLRGLAHAGAKGNRQAIIAANAIECPQIRIANIIKEQYREEEQQPKYAYVNENNEIILE